MGARRTRCRAGALARLLTRREPPAELAAALTSLSSWTRARSVAVVDACEQLLRARDALAPTFRRLRRRLAAAALRP